MLMGILVLAHAPLSLNAPVCNADVCPESMEGAC